MLKRGVSPRIVTAEVLGSRGESPVSGPELEARLGLDSTWAYFSVKNGSSVTREPDLSGQAPFAPRDAGKPAARRPRQPTTGPQGGAQAPGTVDALATGGAAGRMSPSRRRACGKRQARTLRRCPRRC